MKRMSIYFEVKVRLRDYRKCGTFNNPVSSLCHSGLCLEPLDIIHIWESFRTPMVAKNVLLTF